MAATTLWVCGKHRGNLDAAKAVQALGCSMAQAAQALQALGEAAKALEAETEMLKRAAAAKRPWYRRGRW